MKNLYENVSLPVKELATLVFGHFGKTPMGWTGIDKLTEYAHNEQFVARVFELYNILKSNKELFLGINPSQYYKIIYKFQLASKSLNVDVNKIVDCYLFLANYSVQVYNYNLKKIEQFIAQNEFIHITEEIMKKNLSYFCALLRSYSETIYCDEHTIAGEIYSPIKSNDGFIIARKYGMLNAKELWKELENFPYKSINIYIKYSYGCKEVQTDIVGNLLSDENLAPYMSAYFIELVKENGDIVAIKDQVNLMEIIQCLQNIIPNLIAAYKSLPLIERLWKKVECEYYALKPIFQLCGKEWRPTYYKIDLKRIANESRPIVKANIDIESLQDDEIIKEKLFILNDPRKHF